MMSNSEYLTLTLWRRQKTYRLTKSSHPEPTDTPDLRIPSSGTASLTCRPVPAAQTPSARPEAQPRRTRRYLCTRSEYQPCRTSRARTRSPGRPAATSPRGRRRGRPGCLARRAGPLRRCTRWWRGGTPRPWWAPSSCRYRGRLCRGA